MESLESCLVAIYQYKEVGKLARAVLEERGKRLHLDNRYWTNPDTARVAELVIQMEPKEAKRNELFRKQLSMGSQGDSMQNRERGLKSIFCSKMDEDTEDLLLLDKRRLTKEGEHTEVLLPRMDVYSMLR